MGEYTLDLTLYDAYEFGPNEQLYFLKIIVDVPKRPFFVLEPKNEPPVFTEELTTEELKFNIGEAWEFILPQVADPDLDEVVVQIGNSDELPFIQVE